MIGQLALQKMYSASSNICLLQTWVASSLIDQRDPTLILFQPSANSLVLVNYHLNPVFYLQNEVICIAAQSMVVSPIALASH